MKLGREQCVDTEILINMIQRVKKKTEQDLTRNISVFGLHVTVVQVSFLGASKFERHLLTVGCGRLALELAMCGGLRSWFSGDLVHEWSCGGNLSRSS